MISVIMGLAMSWPWMVVQKYLLERRTHSMKMADKSVNPMSNFVPGKCIFGAALYNFAQKFTIGDFAFVEDILLHIVVGY